MSKISNKLMNVALVGTGMVAGTHLQAIADLSSKLKLTSVFSRSMEHSTAFAEKASQLIGSDVIAYSDSEKIDTENSGTENSGTKSSGNEYSGIESLCKDDELDFVIVLTPPNARLEIVQALAQAGKHILMEKPVERSSDAAKTIVDICVQNNVKLGIVFQHRMRAASRILTKLVHQKALGDLRIAEVIVPWWRDQSYYDEAGRGTYERDGGGVLISQAIHSLDLMLSLTGPVSKVQAMASTTSLHSMQSEDYVSAGLKFTNGAVGTLIASTASYPGDAESITLHFDKAVARLQSGELSLHWRDGRTELLGKTAATGGGADPMAFTHEWHRDIIADFASAIVNNHQPAIPGHTALEVHRLIDGLIKSSRGGHTVDL